MLCEVVSYAYPSARTRPIGLPGISPALVACHHGIIGLTRQAAVEYAKHGVRVNAGCPTVTRTPRLQRTHGIDPEIEARLASRNPSGRIGEAEDAAEAAAKEESDDAIGEAA